MLFKRALRQPYALKAAAFHIFTSGKVLPMMQREGTKTKRSQSFHPFKQKLKPRDQPKFKPRWTKSKSFYKGNLFADTSNNNSPATSSKAGNVWCQSSGSSSAGWAPSPRFAHQWCNFTTDMCIREVVVEGYLISSSQSQGISIVGFHFTNPKQNIRQCWIEFSIYLKLGL